MTTQIVTFVINPSTRPATQPSTRPSRWRVLPTLSAYQEYCDQLVKILSDFRSYDDILSLRLHRWGVKVVSTPLPLLTPLTLESAQTSPVPRFQEQMEKFLEKLTKKILVNPLNEKYPLECPVLDRKWTWEKWALDQYRDLTKRSDSPYDNQPIEERPHLFARAMIACVKTLRVQDPMEVSPWNYLVPHFASSGIYPGVYPEVSPEQIQATYSMYYQNLAQRAISNQMFKETMSAASKMQKDEERRAEESRKYIAEQKENNEKRLDQLFTTFKKGMEANKAAHKKEETDALKEKQRVLQEKQDKCDREAERMRAQIAKQEEEIQRLFRENEQRRREIAELYARSHNDSSCVLL